MQPQPKPVVKNLDIYPDPELLPDSGTDLVCDAVREEAGGNRDTTPAPRRMEF